MDTYLPADAPVLTAVEEDMPRAWSGFEPGRWTRCIDVRDFIQRNVTPYTGDGDFLAGPTEATLGLWQTVSGLLKEERAKGVLDAETKLPAGITAYGPGYIDRALEKVVGLQTDRPLKRQIMPRGGVRLVASALDSYGYRLDPETERIFSQYRKTHNEAVFDAYTPAIKAARKSGIVTGLPDAYGRGRIIGDYRRVPLYGIDRLIADKRAQHASLDQAAMDEATIRLREEIAEQIHALDELARLGDAYGFDLRRPAETGTEAVQWLYLAYLAATREQDGAAMSLGRVSTFLDIYLARDIATGRLDEAAAQELIDHLVMKLRMIRFLRPPEYNQLFSGDPTWVTECLGGIGLDGRPLVTPTSFRFLQTLVNLGPAPEPNLTVLWSERLPEGWKQFCADVSIATSSIQYEDDEQMRAFFGDDYGVACCVSGMAIGKQMQFFGARVNLAKCLLYAINGGRDEKSGAQVGPALAPIADDILAFETVMDRFDAMMDWLAATYAQAMNIIHASHDRYNYERIEMALHDRDVLRTMAYGMAGLSVAADSLSAIRHARVRPIRDDRGLAVDFEIEGAFPTFGNNDDRVDDLAIDLVERFMAKLRRHETYRDAVPTMSILTITSNVVYGKATGATPDGRKAGEPFAPGANPMHGRDRKGALASMASVAKLPYEDAADGISYTVSVVPGALGKTESERRDNLIGLLDGYFAMGGQHINVNVLDRETLLDAMAHPENYPQLTVRVSGYAVNFIKLTAEQQQDVITRTFHARA